MRPECPESTRLVESRNREKDWQRWGTYLPERQWGTVREDYSADGQAWESFPFEMSQYRAYRWGEDGMLGWTDRHCRLAFSFCLWNGKDPCLKERMFGLSGKQGNHGEDVKELYYYLDGTPTGSYAKALYKYPQGEFPYQDLLDENKRRGRHDSEYELLDTGIFSEDRYFDVTVEYAKRDVEDMLVRLTVANRGPEAAPITILPTLTLRNTWSWGTDAESQSVSGSSDPQPRLHQEAESAPAVRVEHPELGRYRFSPAAASSFAPQNLLFTENETNFARLDPTKREEVDPVTLPPRYTKDAFNRFCLHKESDAVNPAKTGTKCALHYVTTVEAGNEVVLYFRLERVSTDGLSSVSLAESEMEVTFAQRQAEADLFYRRALPPGFTEEAAMIARQAYAGLLWTKQAYFYVVERWLKGDSTQPTPPAERLKGRNHLWVHFFARDVISMPDKWEYPWFAAWDLAFQVVPFAAIDPDFAKAQLLLLLREWYSSPDGQMPAYEFKFSDVNPPVHAWAVLHVYRMTALSSGAKDTDFLERAFQKLLLNFTWWASQASNQGHTLFGGGFLGLDNIGVFDRSQPLPNGMKLVQADGTAWMGFYCACMLQMAIELAQTRPAYEDIASKFFAHYVSIIETMNLADGEGLWNEDEGFYFDQIRMEDGSTSIVTKIWSIVGLVPLYGIALVTKEHLEKLPALQSRVQWFLREKPYLHKFVQVVTADENPKLAGAHYMSLVPRERFKRVLSKALEESEFLSEFGIRSLSKRHLEHPFELSVHGMSMRVNYTPAEGDSELFGGNSNWRGPIWFPVNGLLALALHRYGAVYGERFTMECPTGSGNHMTMAEVANEIWRRLSQIYLTGESGHRPVHGASTVYRDHPAWNNLLQFYEYFCGDTGRGCGASHQTGWTALITLALVLEG